MIPSAIYTMLPCLQRPPIGSPILDFVRNIGLLFDPRATRQYRGVLFRRRLFRFLVSDVARRCVSVHDFYRYVSYAVSATRHLETEFLYENLRQVMGRKRYLDVASPRVVPYFLCRCQRLDHATLINPDVVDLQESRRSVGCACTHVEYLPIKLGELTTTSRYDLITSVSVVEHIVPDQTATFIRSMAALLSPGGVCLLTFPCAQTEMHEYRNADPYSTQPYDDSKRAYYFQKYFTPDLIQNEILSVFKNVVAMKVFGEVEKGRYLKYEKDRAAFPTYSSSRDHKVISKMFQEYASIAEMPGLGVCCLLLKKD